MAALVLHPGMATKNLGRTAVERGRTNSYKTRVKEIESSFRADTRRYEDQIANDVDAVDDLDEPVRHPKSKRGNQTDNLNAVWRMLDTMAGRSWAKVYAEICEKFDARTLAGRHVLHDHILYNIAQHEDTRVRNGWRYTTYFVDKHGIFRKRPKSPRYATWRKPITQKQAQKIVDWLDGRAVIRQGAKLYWASSVDSKTGIRATFHGWREHVTSIGYGEKLAGWHGGYYDSYSPSFGWRQNRAFSREEAQFFDALPEWVQKALIVHDEDAAAA